MSVRRLSTRWSLLVVLLLFVAACGASTDADTADTAPAGESDDSQLAAPAGDGTDGGLVAPTTESGQVAFNDLQGQPTLVWFWAPW